jgi:hypothetical protein
MPRFDSAPHTCNFYCRPPEHVEVFRSSAPSTWHEWRQSLAQLGFWPLTIEPAREPAPPAPTDFVLTGPASSPENCRYGWLITFLVGPEMVAARRAYWAEWRTTRYPKRRSSVAAK